MPDVFLTIKDSRKNSARIPIVLAVMDAIPRENNISANVLSSEGCLEIKISITPKRSVANT